MMALILTVRIVATDAAAALPRQVVLLFSLVTHVFACSFILAVDETTTWLLLYPDINHKKLG